MFKAQFIGNLGSDAAAGTTQRGGEYMTFSVATKSGYGEKERTVWVDCLMPGKTAVFNYLKKGSQVFVEGDLSLSVYGNKPQANVSVKTLKLIGRKDA